MGSRRSLLDSDDPDATVFTTVMLLTRPNPAVAASLASPCLQFIVAPAPNTFPADSQALSSEGSDAALPPHLLKCRQKHPAGEAVRPGCYLDGTCRVRVGATTSLGIDKPLVGLAGKPYASSLEQLNSTQSDS